MTILGKSHKEDASGTFGPREVSAVKMFAEILVIVRCGPDLPDHL